MDRREALLLLLRIILLIGLATMLARLPPTSQAMPARPTAAPANGAFRYL